MSPAILRFLIGIFCFVMAAIGLSTGTLRMKAAFRRDTQPGMYWFGIVMYVSLGLTAMILALKG